MRKRRLPHCWHEYRSETDTPPYDKECCYCGQIVSFVWKWEATDGHGNCALDTDGRQKRRVTIRCGVADDAICQYRPEDPRA